MENVFENEVTYDLKTDLVCGGESRLGMCAGERKAACLPMRVDPTSFHSPSAACHTSYTVHRYMENSYSTSELGKKDNLRGNITNM